MNAEVLPLFSIPLYKTKLSCDLKTILNYTKNSKFVWLEEVKNGYRSEQVNILDSLELREIKNEIQNHIIFFTQNILKIEKSINFYITNSWIVKHEKNNWSQKHYHDNSLISGIYYFNVNEETGKLIFHKEHHFLNLFPSILNIPFDESSIFNSSEVIIEPNNGDLIMFPSHLLHSVSENKSDIDRYCLVFNCFIKGKLGTNIGMNELEIK